MLNLCFSIVKNKLKNNNPGCAWESSSSSTPFPIVSSPGLSLYSVRLDKSSTAWLFSSVLCDFLKTGFPAVEGTGCGCWGHWAKPVFVTGYIIEPFKPMWLIRKLDLKVKICWIKRVQVVGLEDGSRVPCPIPMLEKVVEHGGTHL